ncbi:MAG TPA: STAS domain-containing protein [Solirubrobacteraceae bacterium]|jgi:anti-anti-sigma factor|nr:STAS domain-containing protein [Solirubrobacteraceae bacterium]
MTYRAQQRDAAPADPLEEGRVFRMSSERDGEVHAIRLFGELDVASAGAVQAELERAEAGDARVLVLDLSGLTFMDSTGVRLVVTAHVRSRAHDGRLELVRGPAAVQRVFEICGVADLLPFAA